MARSMQQCINPEVETWRAKVDGEACRELKQNCVTKEARRNKQREKTHAKALQEWKLDNPKCKQPIVPPVTRVSWAALLLLFTNGTVPDCSACFVVWFLASLAVGDWSDISHMRRNSLKEGKCSNEESSSLKIGVTADLNDFRLF